MSPNFGSPVQTEKLFSVRKPPLNGEYPASKRINGKPVGRRRVFVQTETGCVLGLDIDRSDNAHILKRKLQVALNVPAEESSLTFGDLVLKNDLSAIRNDYPLLLTRNFLHRSSSTPCISVPDKDLQQNDQSGPIEIIGCTSRSVRIKRLVKEIVKAIKNGVDPLPAHGGLGGAYYFRNSIGESIAIVKPTDEEPFAPNNPKGFVGKALGQPGLKRSVRVGETGFREVAAYLLDHDHFANVPPTALVKISHSVFNVNGEMNSNRISERKQVSKIASFQQFIAHDFDASEHGASSFPVANVHRIGILDVRILNTDRHGGNLLVRKLEGIGGLDQVDLVPIDHGLCLPENLEDPYFEWVHWPQASIPFSEDELEYIRNLDPSRDSDMLRAELPMIREACLRVLVLCTTFLKEASAFGLCLAEIGEMMSREFRSSEEEPSEFEAICLEARRMIADQEPFSPKSEAGAKDGVQFDMDSEGAVTDSTPSLNEGKVIEDLTMKTSFCYCRSTNGRSSLSKLEESLNEGVSEGEEDMFVGGNIQVEPVVSLLSLSLANTNLDGENGIHQIAKRDSDGMAAASSVNTSANEQLPGSTCFVKLMDMNEDEWLLFLDKFQELLRPSFARRNSVRNGQRQRLGTSCKF